MVGSKRSIRLIQRSDHSHQGKKGISTTIASKRSNTLTFVSSWVDDLGQQLSNFIKSQQAAAMPLSQVPSHPQAQYHRDTYGNTSTSTSAADLEGILCDATTSITCASIYTGSGAFTMARAASLGAGTATGTVARTTLENLSHKCVVSKSSRCLQNDT